MMKMMKWMILWWHDPNSEYDDFYSLMTDDDYVVKFKYVAERMKQLQIDQYS